MDPLTPRQDAIAELERLDALRASGAVTDAKHESLKRRALEA